MNWKEILATAAIGLVLSLWVSCCAPVEVSAPSPGGEGTRQEGDASLVVSGDRAEKTTVIARSEATWQSPPDTEETETGDCHGPAALAMTETGDPLRGYWYGRL